MADIVSEGKWKEQLITTIGKVGHPRYAYFIGGYKDDKAVGVRKAVAHGLGLITNDDFTLPVLIQLLSRSNEDFLVRWEASNAMVTMGKRGDAQAVRKRLGDLLRDREKLTVLLTARALAILGEEKGSLKLREMAMDGDPKIRMEAVMYLGEVTDVGSKDILIKSVKDDNLAVRACAMYALGRIGDASMIATLRKAFEGSTDYMATLEKQLKESSSEEALKQKYGVGVFDLRQTLQEAIDTIQKKDGKD
jgi:HEAT repeat protein